MLSIPSAYPYALSFSHHSSKSPDLSFQPLRYMPCYEDYDTVVYDNVEVQRVTRSQAAATTGVVAVLLMITLAVLALGIDGIVPLWLGVAVPVLTWTGFVYWILRRRERLRRVVWCVKLSRRDIAGYDYARRRITIAWGDVERLDVSGEGLTVIGPDSASLEITHLFPEFAQVSHRVMQQADRHGVAVYVEGRPWQQIDVYSLFPFLTEDASSSPQRGSTV